MKNLVTLCFMVLLGLVVAQNGRGACGCRRVFEFCANDYTTYHSICEYKCKHPSTPFQDWYILYEGPCSGSETTDQPFNPNKSDKDPSTTKKPTSSTTTLVPRLMPGYEWYRATGSSYKVHTVAQTWHDAEDICRAEGGYLAIINSKIESTIMKDLFNKNTFGMITGTPDRYKYFAAIGFRKTDGQWLTVQGEYLDEAGFDEWSPGYPIKKHYVEGGSCGTMYWDGLISQGSCQSLYPFICEITPARD